MSLLQETKQFAREVHLPWRFDEWRDSHFAVMDNRGNLVAYETLSRFEEISREMPASGLVAFEAWQQCRCRWQFIVSASELFPKMFATLDL